MSARSIQTVNTGLPRLWPGGSLGPGTARQLDDGCALKSRGIERVRHQRMPGRCPSSRSISRDDSVALFAWRLRLFLPKQWRLRKANRVNAIDRARSRAMTTEFAAGLSSTLTPDHRPDCGGDAFAHAGIIGALLEALNSPESYRLVHCDGELYLESVSET
jgi:hypothetical protein